MPDTRACCGCPFDQRQEQVMQESSTTYQPRLGFLIGLVLLSVGVRILPYLAADPESLSYLWGVTPLFAICLFGAAYFTETRSAYLVPLASYLASDLLIWVISGRIEWGFYPGQPFVYLAVALNVVIGFVLRKHRSWPVIAGAGILGGLTFFMISNFGVWVTAADRSLHPATLDGLLNCYILAIPFYRNLTLSTLVFSAALFSPLGVKSLAAQDEHRTVRERV
jgi:hypothetical protein